MKKRKTLVHSTPPKRRKPDKDDQKQSQPDQLISFLCLNALCSLGLTVKRLGSLLTRRRLQAIKHHRANVCLVEAVFTQCAMFLVQIHNKQRMCERIFSIQEFRQKSKWTTLLDKFTMSSPSDPSTLATLLFKILVQELISSAKACKPFWMPQYKDVSEKLSLPTRTDFRALHTNLSNRSWSNVEERLRFSTTMIHSHVKRVSKSWQTTCLPSCISLPVDKWENGSTKLHKAILETKHAVMDPRKKAEDLDKKTAVLKTTRVQILPTAAQKLKLWELVHVCRHVYNKAVHYIDVLEFAQDERLLKNALVPEHTMTASDEYAHYKHALADQTKLKAQLQAKLTRNARAKDHDHSDNKWCETCADMYIGIADCNLSIESLIAEKKEALYGDPKYKLLGKRKTVLSKKLVSNARSKVHTKKFHMSGWCDICADLSIEITDCELEMSEMEDASKTGVAKQRNPIVADYEIAVPKALRDDAVKNALASFKSAKSNLRTGNIKYFDIGYKRKTNKRQCIEIASSCIGFDKQTQAFRLTPGFFSKANVPSALKVVPRRKHKNGKRKMYDFDMCHNCDLLFDHGKWYIIVTKLARTVDATVCDTLDNIAATTFCGGDLGLRKFLTIYGTATKNGSHTCEMYIQRQTILKKLNAKIEMMKYARIGPLQQKFSTRKGRLVQRRRSCRGRALRKLETRKASFTNELHWTVVNDLVSKYDVMYIGDIKSHDIVSGSKRHAINRDFNDLKMHLFKKRLTYKALVHGKHVVFPNEAYTSQGCSACGALNRKLGSSEIFSCKQIECMNKNMDRDLNSAKNMCLKGIVGIEK